MKVSQIMRQPAVVIHEDTSLEEAARIMLERKLRGLLSMSCTAGGLVSKMSRIRRNVFSKNSSEGLLFNQSSNIASARVPASMPRCLAIFRMASRSCSVT